MIKLKIKPLRPSQPTADNNLVATTTVEPKKEQLVSPTAVSTGESKKRRVSNTEDHGHKEKKQKRKVSNKFIFFLLYFESLI